VPTAWSAVGPGREHIGSLALALVLSLASTEQQISRRPPPPANRRSTRQSSARGHREGRDRDAMHVGAPTPNG
jgi:hypothetical protein